MITIVIVGTTTISDHYAAVWPSPAPLQHLVVSLAKQAVFP